MKNLFRNLFRKFNKQPKRPSLADILKSFTGPIQDLHTHALANSEEIKANQQAILDAEERIAALNIDTRELEIASQRAVTIAHRLNDLIS